MLLFKLLGPTNLYSNDRSDVCVWGEVCEDDIEEVLQENLGHNFLKRQDTNVASLSMSIHRSFERMWRETIQSRSSTRNMKQAHGTEETYR